MLRHRSGRLPIAAPSVQARWATASADLSHAEWLGLLVDGEVASRNTRRFQTRMRAARLRHIGAAIEDVDFRTPRKPDRALFQQLATGRWIGDARNLMITGPCGVGKTWLACALGQKACRDNLTVIYQRRPRLFADLELAHGPSRACKHALPGNGWSLSPPVPITREGRPAHPGRLGPGPPERRAAP